MGCNQVENGVCVAASCDQYETIDGVTKCVSSACPAGQMPDASSACVSTSSWMTYLPWILGGAAILVIGATMLGSKGKTATEREREFAASQQRPVGCLSCGMGGYHKPKRGSKKARR